MQDIQDTVTAGGGVDGSGTAGKISKWLDANTVTDSIMAEAGALINLTGGLTTNTAYRVHSFLVVKGLYKLDYAVASGTGFKMWALYNDINCTSLHTLGDSYASAGLTMYIDVPSTLYLGITK